MYMPKTEDEVCSDEATSGMTITVPFQHSTVYYNKYT